MLHFGAPPALLRVVIVNLRSDHESALRGVLWQARGAWLVLRDVSVLRGGSDPTPLDGEAIVHRDNVAFLQAVP